MRTNTFTTQQIHIDARDYFETKLDNWLVKFPKESIESYIKMNLIILNAQDYIIFTTLNSSFRFFAKMDFRPKTIVIIHNVNATFYFNNSVWMDRSSIQNYFIDFLKFLKSKIYRDVFFKQKLLQKIDYISFPSKFLSSYAQSLSIGFESKMIEPLPFSFFEKPKINTDQIIISIPGSVKDKLRDYELIYQVLKKIIPTCEKKIIFQLLGSSGNEYGRKLVNRIKSLENEKFKLVSFQRLLSQKEFDHYLGQTDIMILPLKQYKKFGVIREEYGKSSISGGLNDMIRFGIPTLLIKTYHVEDIFAPLISTFSNKEGLLELLSDWINNEKHIEIKKAAYPMLVEMGKEKNRIKTNKILGRLL